MAGRIALSVDETAIPPDLIRPARTWPPPFIGIGRELLGLLEERVLHR